MVMGGSFFVEAISVLQTKFSSLVLLVSYLEIASVSHPASIRVAWVLSWKGFQLLTNSRDQLTHLLCAGHPLKPSELESKQKLR